MASNLAHTDYREDGISMFEFVWVLLILMILYAVSYTYLAKMNETVERTDFVRTLNRVQAQLTLNVAEWYASGKRLSVRELEGQNPIDLIELAPDNYQGELTSKELSNCGYSRWCYLKDTKRLVYRVKHSAELDNSYKHEEFLVYRLQLTLAAGQKDKGLPTALTLVSEHQFTWQNVGF
jgi:competence protein ComGC